MMLPMMKGGKAPAVVTTTIRLEVADLWKRLFDDEASKDVELIAKDGSVRVHSVVLANLSDPFKAALTSGMRESVTKQIQIREYSVAQLQFMLRLVYTGHIDESEFTPTGPQTNRVSQHLAHSNATGKASAQCVDSPFRGSPRLMSEHTPVTSVIPVKVPIDILLGCASIANTYQIRGVANIMLDKIKEALDQENFGEVFSCAIALDWSPLKVCCVRFAEGSQHVWDQFQKGALSPEVMYELQAVWQMPDCGGIKAQTTFF